MDHSSHDRACMHQVLFAFVVTCALLAPAAATEALQGMVSLSDGTEAAGEIRFANDQILLHEPGSGQRYSIRLAEVRTIESVVDEQRMEEKWIFRESGLDDKVYLGQFYPVRYYLTHVTFHDGRRLSGHILPATLYVHAEGARRRFILRRKQEGEVGEGLNELVFVRSIALGEGAGVRGRIHGTLALTEGEQLRRVVALNRDKMFAVEGKFTPKTGEFAAYNCTGGVYDIIVVTNRAVHLAFSAEYEDSAQRLSRSDVQPVQQWVNSLRDFFHTRRIMYAAGNDERTWALVWQERRGGTTLKGAERIHRWDVWAMHRPNREWQVQERFFVWRAVSSHLGLEPLDVVINPALGGHRVSAETPELELRIELVPTGEEAIPEPEEAVEQSDTT